jgi:hypothetical protein
VILTHRLSMMEGARRSSDLRAQRHCHRCTRSLSFLRLRSDESWYVSEKRA